MSLSKQERQAWNELERVLAEDLPYTYSQKPGVLIPDPSSAYLPPSFKRALILILALALGIWCLLLGAIAHLLPMALTGLGITCIAAHRLRRPLSRVPSTKPET